MRIVQIEIENFRGIKCLPAWSPEPGLNCFIGPGDSTKTTILDGIELCLNPRPYFLADDSDFFNLDVGKRIRIIVTLTDLPEEFKAEDRYGLYLRGWNASKAEVEDEPSARCRDALSILVEIDKSLEARWSFFNNRIASTGGDPPSIRYKDAQRFATNRLGAYADRHLSWGRMSVLHRVADAGGSFATQLAEARRAARKAFRDSDQSPFKGPLVKAENLSKLFSVPVRAGYTAELDLEGTGISSGVIALHDGHLPLRRLGTGSSRLIVAALQHEAGPSSISLIDEIEHGLEPHRIARLVKHLRTPSAPGGTKPQVFLTTHSPFAILELTAGELFAVRSSAGKTTVHSVAERAQTPDIAQRNLRALPEAFLARRIVVGEGRTEQGLIRGLDDWWSGEGKESFALKGAIVVDGGGKDKAPLVCEHLLNLQHAIFFLHDTDELPNAKSMSRLLHHGGRAEGWEGQCSTEQRIFLDVPWDTACKLVDYALRCKGHDSVLAHLNNASVNSATKVEIKLIDTARWTDSEPLRQKLGIAAKSGEWFKDLTRGECVGHIIGPCLEKVPTSPLARSLQRLREWIDAP